MTGSPDHAEVGPHRMGEPREWHRVAALALFVAFSSFTGPFSVIAVPFLVMVLGLPVRQPTALLLALAVMAFWVASPPTSGNWYLERAWGLLLGGSFVGLTLAWPRARFIHRGVAAVAAASGVAALAFAVRPGSWATVDWGMRDRLMEGASQAIQAVRQLQPSEPLPEGLEASALQLAEVQAHLFPAVLGLGSLAGLAIAWWLYARVAIGSRGALGSLREFRFQDQMVWILIGGLALTVVALGEGWTRLGHNTVVFMAALYILRGAGVALFLNGGLGILGGMVLAAGMLVIAPVILTGALLIGLGDTWLDVRTRVRRLIG